MLSHKLRDPFRWISVVTIAVALCGSLSWYATAQDQSPSLPPVPEGEQVDPFQIPENANAETLMDQLQLIRKTAQSYRPQTQAEYIVFMKKIGEVNFKLGAMGLSLENLTPEQQIAFFVARIQGFSIKGQIDDPRFLKEGRQFISQYFNSSNQQLVQIAHDVDGQFESMLFPTMSKEEKQQYIDAAFQKPEEQGLNRFNLRPVLELTEMLEDAGDPQMAAAAYERFAKLASESENENIANLAEQMKGSARRVQLPGNKMEVFGTTLSGEEFDWESYRGKVVLIDFWATWCGPCLQELPNVKANYAKYHDLGFEVVGVNLDENKEQLEQFLARAEIPWVNLFPPDPTQRRYQNPLALYYGVMKVPTAILVDQEGKVVTMMARGPYLEQHLEELLGEPAK